MKMLHGVRIFGAFVIALAASGCASTTSPDSVDQNDPYESFNRQIFSMNMTLDNNVALPVAKFYVHAVPEPAREGVHNFLANLGDPQTFANDVLQGEVTKACTTLGRFTINTTIGIGGLVDAAAKFGIEGWMESLTPEIAPFGIRTMLVEPGFFRTELLTNDSTTYAQPTIDDYAERTREIVAAWKSMDGKQGGDPAKLADALVKLVALKEPPTRFPAGADAVQTFETKANTLLAQGQAHRELSSSLSY